MGLSHSTHLEDKNKTIKHLEEKISQQNTVITLLNTEIDVLRTSKHHKGIKKDLSEINKVWESKDYQYLVFSGGGVKGISYCGALLELEKQNVLMSDNITAKIKEICGVSAGSIVAALLAVGYTPQEVYDEMTHIDFEKIADDKLGVIRDTINFIDDWGVCPGEYIMELMGKLIKKKTGHSDYTIENLYNDKGIKLVIVTTDMTYQRSVYLYPGNPKKEFSTIPINVAIRMSMGIPFVFEPYEYHGSYFADGGILDNYPLHVFDGEYPGDPKARLNLCKPNPHVLGLKIMTTNETMNYDLIPKQVYDSLFDYGMGFVNTFLAENDRRIMIATYWIRSIMMITPNYPISKFVLTEEEKQSLICIGKDGVDLFFAKKAIDDKEK